MEIIMLPRSKCDLTTICRIYWVCPWEMKEHMLVVQWQNDWEMKVWESLKKWCILWTLLCFWRRALVSNCGVMNLFSFYLLFLSPSHGIMAVVDNYSSVWRQTDAWITTGTDFTRDKLTSRGFSALISQFAPFSCHLGCVCLPGRQIGRHQTSQNHRRLGCKASS